MDGIVKESDLEYFFEPLTFFWHNPTFSSYSVTWLIFAWKLAPLTWQWHLGLYIALTSLLYLSYSMFHSMEQCFDVTQIFTVLIQIGPNLEQLIFCSSWASLLAVPSTGAKIQAWFWMASTTIVFSILMRNKFSLIRWSLLRSRAARKKECKL